MCQPQTPSLVNKRSPAVPNPHRRKFPSQQQCNEFHVSKAAATSSTRKYRNDMNMKAQVHAAERYRKKSLASANTADWHATFASRQDHVHFVFQLLVEAERYGRTDPSLMHALKATQLKRLQEADEDLYMSVTQELGAMRLFQRDADTTTTTEDE